MLCRYLSEDDEIKFADIGKDAENKLFAVNALCWTSDLLSLYLGMDADNQALNSIDHKYRYSDMPTITLTGKDLQTATRSNGR